MKLEVSSAWLPITVDLFPDLRILLTVTVKGQPFVWEAAQEKPFQNLEERLITAPVLASPKDGVEYVSNKIVSKSQRDWFRSRTSTTSGRYDLCYRICQSHVITKDMSTYSLQ
jgi:hypothetical protein